MKRYLFALKDGLGVYKKNLWRCTLAFLPVLMLIFLGFFTEIAGKYLVKTYSPDLTSVYPFADSNFFMLLATFAKYLIFALSVPLYYGLYIWLVELKRGNRHKIYECFGFYTKFSLILKCLTVKAFDFAVKLLILSPTLIPLSASVWMFSLLTKYSGYGGEILSLFICFCVLTVVAFIACLTLMQKTHTLDYIFVTNPEKPLTWIIRTSLKSMKRRKSESFVFKALIAALLMPCILIIPIAVLVPALMLCVISYTADICADIS